MPFCNFKLTTLELVQCSHVFIEWTYGGSYFVLEGKNARVNGT